MKKIFTMAVLMTIAIAANAMTYTEARTEALFLSDKMAYELNLSPAQYDAVYEINLDYMLSLGTRADLFGNSWSRRNTDLWFVLTSWQYDRYMTLEYFYRPMGWHNGAWTFSIYSIYGRNLMFNAHPTVFVSYRGGHNHVAGSHYANRDFNKPKTITPNKRTGEIGPKGGNTAHGANVAYHNGNANNHGAPHTGNTNVRNHNSRSAATGNANVTVNVNNNSRFGPSADRSGNMNTRSGNIANRTGNTPVRGGSVANSNGKFGGRK